MLKKFKKCLIVACVCLVAGLGLSIKTKAAPSFYSVVSTHLLTTPFDTNYFIFEGDILPDELSAGGNYQNFGVLLVTDDGTEVGGGWFSDKIVVNNQGQYQIIYTGMTLSPTGDFINLIIIYDETYDTTSVALLQNNVSIVSPNDGYFINFIKNTLQFNCTSCPENPDCPETEVGTLSQFLIDGVGGFLNFEIIPGWSLIGILSVFLAIALVVIILRYFAGG